MGWAQDTISSPSLGRLFADPPQLWARVRYRQLREDARTGALDDPLAVIVAGRRWLGRHAQLDRLAGAACETLVRQEAVHGHELAARAWAVCDPAGRVRGKRATERLPVRALEGGARRLRHRLPAVLDADPSPAAARAAARMVHLELLHTRSVAVASEPRVADRLLREVLPAEMLAAVGYGDAKVGVDREAWRRVFALVLVELSREEAGPDEHGREVWLRAKVRGELVRAAEGRGRPTSGFPPEAEALLEATRARRGARRRVSGRR